MIEYIPIGDLVRSIPDTVWNALAEIHKKRPAIMLGELLAVAERKRAPQQEPEGREPRSLSNHPGNPARAPSQSPGDNMVKPELDHLDRG